jgi:hypothetical protein
MVSNGQVIAQKVAAQMQYNGEQNFLSLSYIDENGILNKTIKSVHDYTLMVDHDTKTINGVLPKNEDWYLFWKNTISPMYGLE